MKKLCSSVAAIAISFMEICGFAEPESGAAASIGRIELIDYILIAGAALFLLGMLFILLSMYAGTDKKKNDIDTDGIEQYDDFAEEEQALEDSEPEEVEEAEETEETAEEVAEVEEAAEPDEICEEAVETEETFEPDKEEAEESLDEEEEVQGESEPELIAEPEPEIEPEHEPEPEPELPKVRITLTGLNNFDVKIMEFTDKATLGRRSGNDIVISDNAVSGSHCEFIVEEEKLYVADLNSTNGTMVNDEPIIKAEINSGDVLVIGKCKYRVNISK